MATRTARRESITGLVLTQLADSPQYLDLITWIAEQFDSVDDMLHFISTINVYEARDKWLDLIGLIVGQSRFVDDAVFIEYFGFADYQNTQGFNVGRFYSDGDPLTASSILPDPEYRAVILSKVAKNYGDISHQGVVEALQVITDSDIVLTRNLSDSPAAFEVYIGAVLSGSIRALIVNSDLIPRGAGIGIDVLTAGDGSNVFGFADYGFAAFNDAPFAERII